MSNHVRFMYYTTGSLLSSSTPL